MLILITGPVRSGKSRFAETRALRGRGPVTYLSTTASHPEDLGWGDRLTQHLARRPRNWRPIDTAGMDSAAVEKLIRTAPAQSTVVVDSLGAWLAERMKQTTGEHPADVMTKLDLVAECFVDACVASKARVIVIGEEVGWGLAPELAPARIFRDVLGDLQQRLAGFARKTYLVVAGYAVDVKTHGERVSPRSRR